MASRQAIHSTPLGAASSSEQSSHFFDFIRYLNPNLKIDASTLFTKRNGFVGCYVSQRYNDL